MALAARRREQRGSLQEIAWPEFKVEAVTVARARYVQSARSGTYGLEGDGNKLQPTSANTRTSDDFAQLDGLTYDEIVTAH